MARYRLIQAVVGQPPSQQYQKFKSGTTIVDSQGNAQFGDVVWPSLCATPQTSIMIPLDAAAVAQFGLQNITVSLNGPWPNSTGVNSVA